MLTLTEAQERVDKGMAWLEEAGPILDFYLDQVDPEKLSILSETLCVLGQSGRTHYELAALRIESTLMMSRSQTIAWTIEHGFNVQIARPLGYSEAVEDGELLTAVWKTAFQERNRRLAMA